MNLTDAANFRYSTKAFQKDKKISTEDFQQIKNLLRLSASSVNNQPWHFIIAETAAGKERIAKGTQGTFIFNKTKVLDASHVILFCVKTDLDSAYLEHILAVEDQDGRFAAPEHKASSQAGRVMFTNTHREPLNDIQDWNEKQLYLNMGTILLGAAVLGIDAVPMEGLDRSILDQEFGLTEKKLAAVAMIALGYRAEDDFNAKLPKSRLPEDEIMTILP